MKGLCLEHLQSFDKSRYVGQIAKEMSEILPDVDMKKIESVALCVSNAMNSEARSKCGQKKMSQMLEQTLVHTVPMLAMAETMRLCATVQLSSQDNVEWSVLFDETLNSTFFPSQLDSTYNGDISITIAKTTARACTKTTETEKSKMLGNRKSAGASSKGKTETSKPKETETKGEKQCVDD